MNNRNSTMKSTIQSRMEMPMGERPAARVVRRSKKGQPISVPTYHNNNRQQHSTNVDDSGYGSDCNEEDDEEQQRMKQMPPMPVVGDIVERTNKSRGKKQSIVDRKSRFGTIVADKTVMETGFPTVNVPLGTFVVKTTTKDMSSNLRSTDHSTLSSSNSSTPTIVPKVADLTNNNVRSLRKASAADADGILAGMSKMEIQESIQELKGTLSPEMVAFIRNRNQSKAKGKEINRSTIESSTLTALPKLETLPATSINQSVAMNTTEAEQERQEKERLANLLSSIRTYEDLDQAYVAEMERHGKMELSDLDNPMLHSSSSIAATDVLNDSELEWEVACDLLRSTSHRQVLWALRVVCNKLQCDLKLGHRYPIKCQQFSNESLLSSTPNDNWPYPILIPVSLRCLLDDPTNRPSDIIQQAYVLQSIYALLLVRAPTDQIIQVRCDSDGILHGADTSTSCIYQLYYMDDAIPTSSLQDYYSTIKPATTSDTGTTTPGIYSTFSSTVSATSDGEEFIRDPMWTLVTKMRIIPRFAEMIHGWTKIVAAIKGSSNQSSNEQSSIYIPTEAVICCCGILSMICERSPGATSAIMNHSTLVKDLFLCSFIPRPDRPSRYIPTLAIPFLVFAVTATRQSRIAAESLQRIDIDTLLLKLLTGVSQEKAELRLQQWALILWRTMLRYGISIRIFPTMLTLATSQITLKRSDQLHDEMTPSLASDWYSCFSVVLHCVRSLQLAAKGTSTIPSKANGDNPVPDDIPILLSKACAWLSSSKHQAINYIRQVDPIDLTKIELLKQVTSIFRFLDVLLKVTLEECVMETGEFKVEEMTPSEEEICVDCVVSILKSTAVKQIFISVLSNVQALNFSEPCTPMNDSLSMEASSCAFVESILGFSNTLFKLEKSDVDMQEKFMELKTGLRELIMLLISQQLNTLHIDNEKPDSRQHPKEKIELSTIMDKRRRDWYNMAHFALYVCAREIDCNKIQSFVRDIRCVLVGRLDLGKERTVAILLSDDDWFGNGSSNDNESNNDNAVVVSSSTATMILSDILVRELCRTETMKKQLDHSFRLQYGPGLHVNGCGPFRLDTLRSECDYRSPQPLQTSSLNEITLPFGQYWPWKLLSGSFISSESNETNNEAVTVFESAFYFIKELESYEGIYSTLNVGGKLYHLSNWCLLPESFLSNKKLHDMADLLFDSYFKQVNGTSAWMFAEECFVSSEKPTSQSSSTNSSSETKQSASDEAIVKKIIEPENFSEGFFTHSHVKTCLKHVGELAEAFMEYGYQYPLFIKCTRLFLIKGFPNRIRCEILTKLREVLYLLSLDDEVENEMLRKIFLRNCLQGGMPHVDNSIRDSPDILDALSMLLVKDTPLVATSRSSSTTTDTFLVLFSLASLARSIAINIKQNGTGLSVSKRRIAKVDTRYACIVMEIVLQFLSSNGTLDDLLLVATNCATSNRTTTRQWFTNTFDEHEWQKSIADIREATRS